MLSLFDDRESSIRQEVCFPNRCGFCLKPSFYSVLQGAHGLKGNEGPHGPPGPAVSTIYCVYILSLSLSFSHSNLPHSIYHRLWELSSQQSSHSQLFHTLM